MRSCSVEAVRKAIRSGRLKNSVVQPDGSAKPKIDPVLANAEWELNTDKSQQKNVKNKPAPAAPLQPYIRNPEAPMSDGPPRLGDAPDLASSAKSTKEYYAAQIAKLEYEAKAGKLIDADQVRHEAFRLARSLRDRVLNIPDRLAAELAGIKDRKEIHKRISHELRIALTELNFGQDDQCSMPPPSTGKASRKGSGRTRP